MFSASDNPWVFCAVEVEYRRGETFDVVQFSAATVPASARENTKIMLLVAMLVASWITSALGCSPSPGWEPKTFDELAQDAEIVAVGTVLALGPDTVVNSTTHAATVSESMEPYWRAVDLSQSALVQVDCLLKGGLECASGLCC